ncbi:divalent-cation tolerance protein CutA [Aeromonas schubertii]|uniref:divalent-cation tolerance protein CutA n=1 Tax=Aeromonas schubertii TaxID=652 RepID=UPI0038B47DB9
MTEAIVVLCTCPDAASADRLCEALLEARLAACINQLPAVTSVYRWEGKVERACEIQLIIKSTARHQGAITECILAHHPYQVPEILTLPVAGGHAPYLAWLAEETR